MIDYYMYIYWNVFGKLAQIKFKNKKFTSDLPSFGQNWVNNRNRNNFFVSADTETDTERAFFISAKPKFGRPDAWKVCFEFFFAKIVLACLPGMIYHNNVLSIL